MLSRFWLIVQPEYPTYYGTYNFAQLMWFKVLFNMHWENNRLKRIANHKISIRLMNKGV